MSNDKNNRTARMNEDQKMSDAILLHLGALGSMPVGDGTYTPAEIAQIYKDRVATNQAALNVNAQRVAILQADLDKRAQTGPLTRAFRRMVQGMFAQSPAILADFGLAPPRSATLSVEARSAAIAKAKATRVARHTMGPKQRAKITGTTVSAGTGSPAAPGSAPAPKADT